MATLLQAAWAKAEPLHPVTKYPTSYWATFADMARAVLAAAPTTAAPVDSAQEDRQVAPAVEWSRFLSDVLTAAGLVEHGKQCKALAFRLGDAVMRIRSAAPPAQVAAPTQQRVNVGTIGHVGHGKTTLTGAIATVLSAVAPKDQP
jgi:hypothetical protein